MWSNRENIIRLVGMQNGTTPLKDRLAVFYKSKHIPTIRSRNHIPWYLPKRVESLCQDRNLNMDIYNSFSHRTKVNG